MPSKVPVFAKERILDVFLSGYEDFLEVAKILNVNSCTAYTIVARRDQGASVIKFDDEKKEKAVDILSKNPLITLKYMNKRLRQEIPEKPQVHIKTLANVVD